jgi:putative phosphoribosyl transferase
MFEDRISAGKKLSEKLTVYESENPLVIALPRGGVAVGFPIAKKLHAQLEVEIVRKLGAPQNLELGIGAIAEDGIVYLDTKMMDYLQVSQGTLHVIQERETAELKRRKQLYRNGKPLPLLTNRTVILVDDGLATGASAHAAILSVKKHHPKKIIFAAPVCSKEIAATIRQIVDGIVCLEFPDNLEAIGRYYEDFRQVNDEEVLTLLQRINGKTPTHLASENDFSHKIVW